MNTHRLFFVIVIGFISGASACLIKAAEPILSSSANASSDEQAQRKILAEDPSAAARYAAFQRARDESNGTRIDFYGKVVDQYGDPIAGVHVKGSILLVVSPISSENKEVTTETDAKGKFQFVGLHGADFGLLLQKTGYESNGKSNWNAAYKADPATPVVFTLWKRRGAEPMVHWELNRIGLSCDGRENKFDLLAGRRSQESGDFIAKFIRTPVDIVRGVPFDWTLTLEIPSGGMAEVNGPYPNEAPADGYKSSITISMRANSEGWSPNFERTYFFTAKNGQIFGRMRVELSADYQPPPTHFEMDVYANPSGSRNLEFDPEKTIKSK